ncbi:MAG TPA: acyl-CoA dehydrogenase family protein [Stellaceae bacterium]|jgi:alkylation response protein AidB-like acyl-CoA dehydrogenase
MPDRNPQKATAVTPEKLYERARALVPVLAERAERCEKIGQCPPETIADLAAAGLLDIAKPARYGGAEHDWGVLSRVGQILAHGCASQAWVCTVLNGHNQLVGAFAPEAQEEVWGKNRDVRFAASVGPLGKARLVEGGAVIAGQFPFASGIDYADWLICGGMLERGDSRPAYFDFLIPIESARVIDDWHVAGLAGTGSKSFVVDEVFVPAHRFQDHIHSVEGSGPGTDFNPAPVFRTPRTTVAVHCFSAIAIGIAEAFLETYIAYTRQRKIRAGENEVGPNQSGLAMESARIEAAAAFQAACLDTWVRRLDAGEVLHPHDRQRARFQAAWIAREALGAVQALFAGSGGHAILDANPLQRQVRDLMAVVAHRGLSLEEAAPVYAKSMLARG